MRPPHRAARLGLGLGTVLTAVLALVIGPAAGLTGQTEDPVVQALEAQLQAGAPLPAAYAVLDGDRTVFGGREGAGPDSPFVIGSVSKSFTALATLVAVSRGELDLDAPVSTYLPEFQLADPAATRRIHLRHLLTHTSGIEGTDCNLDLNRPSGSLSQRVTELRSVRPAADPGVRFAYCNVGFAVLARTLEVTAGRPYPEVLRSTVLQPLGLAGTHTDAAGARAAGLIEGRTTVMGLPLVRPENDFEAALADGYVMSTARDLATYARFQMGDGTAADGTRILPTELMRAMHQGAAAVPDQEGTILASYAMGWFTGIVDGRRVVTHSGTTDRYHADIVMVPSDRRAVVDLVAGQWLSNARSTADGATAVLLGRPPEVSMLYRTATVVLWAALATLLLTVAASVHRARTRRRVGRRPRLWAAVACLVGAVGLALLFTLPAVQQTGTVGNAVHFGWLAAPDALVLELAWPSVLLWVGARALIQRRALHLDRGHQGAQLGPADHPGAART